MGETVKQPALMLPMGENDYNDGNRMEFLKSCVPILNDLGWTVGVELKGDLKNPDWAKKCCNTVRSFGGRITYHLPNSSTKQFHLGISPGLEALAIRVAILKRIGLEAATIHCAPAVSIEPLDGIGLERYNSLIGAQEMIDHIGAQVESLLILNEMVDRILQIENLDITNFCGGGFRTPTYLALQTGSWHELFWLKGKSDVEITFDSEHYFCARNLLMRQGQEDLENLLTFDPINTQIITENQRYSVLQLSDTIAGYYLIKGYPPYYSGGTSLTSFINTAKPKLFHLGGGVQAVDLEGRIATHLPSFESLEATRALTFELKWITSHPEVIGAVIEVTGKLQGKYSEWSPRPENDEVAKMQAYLEVIDWISKLKNSNRI